VKSVYIETTVVSYFVARPRNDVIVAARQASTHALWPKLTSEYECYVSVLVQEEVGKGEREQALQRLDAIQPFAVLETDQTANELASRILDQHGIPREFPEDAVHIAIAAVNGIDVLVTWNFAHLNNPFTRAKVRDIVEATGYVCPEICSPDELLEVEP
jgi:hypothetical protein